MTLLAFENFGSDIVWSTADSTLTLTIELKLGGQTEISDLDFHLVVNEEVTKLEISVDDAMTVKIFDGSADLIDVALHLELV